MKKGYGTYKGKSLAPGGGGRFAKITDALKKKGKSVAVAGAIAAEIGREKYGQKKMTEWSSLGKKRGKA